MKDKQSNEKLWIGTHVHKRDDLGVWRFHILQLRFAGTVRQPAEDNASQLEQSNDDK